jgi:hypothetical protein
MKTRLAALSGVMTLFVGALGAAAPARAVEINAQFSSTYGCSVCGVANVVSLQGNAAAQGAILAATQQISSQFGDNLTANIAFFGVHGGTTGNEAFLGGSISGQTVYSFSQYSTALAADAAAHPLNTVLNSGVANLTTGNGAGHPFVVVNTTDARLLGLNVGVNTLFGPSDATPEFSANGAFVGGGGVADAIVYINLDQPFDYTRPISGFSSPPGPIYDAQSIMEHEIDEVMGIGGAGSQLNNFNFDPAYALHDWGLTGSPSVMGVMDLYRYQSAGVGSFDPTTVSISNCPAQLASICSGLPSPYFSVDGGTTSIDAFNQAFPVFGGDAADWGVDFAHGLCPGGGGFGGSGDVQDAFSCNNRSPDVTVGTPSFKAFESIGYNPVPEPAGWALMIAGFGLMGAVLRRRPTTAAATA